MKEFCTVLSEDLSGIIIIHLCSNVDFTNVMVISYFMKWHVA